MVRYPLPEEALDSGGTYVIYGTGEVASEYAQQLIARHGEAALAGFLDSQPRGSEWLGKPLVKPSAWHDAEPYRYVLGTVSAVSAAAMQETLLASGVPAARITFRLHHDLRKPPVLNRPVGRIALYPPPVDHAHQTDIERRLAWFLPSPAVQPEVVSDPSTLEAFDLILLTADIDLAPFARSLVPLATVDPHYFSLVESENYRRLLYWTQTAEQRDLYERRSKENYARFLHSQSGKRKAHVFGTGPSIEAAYAFDFRGSLNIVCNSIVKNERLLEHIQPDLLVFADPVFHFSHCEYARAFRAQAVEMVHRYDCPLVVPDFTVPLLLSHFPELSAKIIGIPIVGTEFHFPTVDDFRVKGTGNILSIYMVPIASQIADTVAILGCDGRAKTETYFWKHNASTQYDDLMESVFNAHPSFFRDRNYEDYYDQHCDSLEQLLAYGEARGKRYESLTFSHIPALVQRAADRQ